jgi:hypothetical protein
MSDEWIDLTDMAAIVVAQAADWEITENRGAGAFPWKGTVWNAAVEYRGRPKHPNTRTITSECWRRSTSGDLTWSSDGHNPIGDCWQRFPAGDITGEVTK